MSGYFVTGATGAVGSAIVPLLLRDPETEVQLLIRADSDATLARRLQELICYWGMSEDAVRRRIIAVRGDATEPRFALDEARYADLLARTTHIIHCAASVRMNYPLDEARRSAAGSAQSILALARTLRSAGQLAKVEFVSTVGIAGKRQGTLPETWIDEPRAFHNTYEQSKAEAETLVRAAIEQEALPITVHRPSMVVGDSREGKIIHFQIFYFICEFLSGCKTRGLYPDFGDVRLDIIPVDHVAEAIAASSRDAASAGRIFHLCSGPQHALRLSDLKHTVRAAFARHGRSVPGDITLPRKLFAQLPRMAAVFVPADRRRALTTLPIYLDYLADSQGFGNPEYLEWATEKSLPRPGPDLPVDTILDYYLSRGRTP